VLSKSSETRFLYLNPVIGLDVKVDAFGDYLGGDQHQVLTWNGSDGRGVLRVLALASVVVVLLPSLR